MKLQGKYQGASILDGRLLLPYVVLQTFPEGLPSDRVKVECLDDAFQLPEGPGDVVIHQGAARLVARIMAEGEGQFVQQ